MVRERSLHPSKITKTPHVSSKSSSKPLPRIFAFNTFFYSLLSSRGYAGVRRWTKKAKINVFDLDRVVIPINKGGFHWILAIVNITEKRIEYYDSMGREGESNENRHVLTNIRNFLQEEAKAQNRSADEIATWSFYVPVTPLPPPLTFASQKCGGQ
jgi:Ulp1 family protease